MRQAEGLKYKEEMKMVVILGSEIQAARLLTLRQGLRLEILGLHRRGPSCYSIIKTEFGLKGDKQSVFDQFTQGLEESGILISK
jgi:hypothetical protein